MNAFFMSNPSMNPIVPATLPEAPRHAALGESAPRPSSLAGLLLAMLSLGACATMPGGDIAPVGTSAQHRALCDTPPKGVLNTVKLQALLDKEARVKKSPGMVMAVQVGDSPPWIGVTGCEDAACTRKMTPDSKFRIGSITKNFVGTAILQQVDEGKLRLDDTLERWLPGVFSNIDGKGITLRQLLNHTSGIESYTEAVEWITTLYMRPTQHWKSPEALLSLAEALHEDSIKRWTVISPGTRFSYSNTNYVLLGMISAKADGYSTIEWEKVIQNRFINKLGLSNTRIPSKKDVTLGSTNRGHVNFHNFFGNSRSGESNCVIVDPNCENTDRDFTEQDMSSAWSAGEMISTAGDLLKWVNAELKGPLLSKAIRAQQQTFIETCHWINCPTDNILVGLGIFKQTKYGFIGHRGEIFGFNGTFQYLPRKDLTVVVLSNRTALDGNHVGNMPEEVAGILFPSLRRQRANETDADTTDNIQHIRLPAQFTPFRSP
uniref:Beta-lactamase n=1 Tax=Cystobacter fuscus TaxID=43 RepID=A0A068FGI7_9BACT|nr:beta-lactamase [Cystobacter fuscus]